MCVLCVWERDTGRETEKVCDKHRLVAERFTVIKWPKYANNTSIISWSLIIHCVSVGSVISGQVRVIAKSNSYIHVHIHTYIHSYIHTYIHTCIHTYIHTYIHTFIHTYIHTYIQIPSSWTSLYWLSHTSWKHRQYRWLVSDWVSEWLSEWESEKVSKWVSEWVGK